MPTNIEGYSISLLGQPVISMNGIPLVIRRKKCRAMIYYVAASSTPVSKDKLEAMFWPESGFDAARHNLNVHLSEIRKQVPNLIESDTDYVCLVPGVTVDVNTFDNCHSFASTDQLSSALKLYRGDFLDGFNVNGSPDFDDWKVTQQEYFLAQYIRALSKIADHYSAEGQYEESIAELLRAINLDPLQEELYRQLMLLYHRSGDLSKLNQLYSRLVELFDAELGEAPSHDTVNLYHSLKKSRNELRVQASSPDSSKNVGTTNEDVSPYTWKTAFVGRKSEIAMMRDIHNASENKFVIVTGAPGVGKSRFIAEYTKQWSGVVVSIKCEPTDAPSGYQPIFRAIHSLFITPKWQNYISKIKKELPPVCIDILYRYVPEIAPEKTIDPGDKISPTQLQGALLRFFITLSDIEKLLLIVDDMHFMTQGTQTFLELLVNSAFSGPEKRLFPVGAYNTARNNFLLSGLLQHLKSRNMLASIGLNPFGRAVMQELASGIKCSDSVALINWLKEKTGGNAMILEAYIQYLRDSLESVGESEIDIRMLSNLNSVPYDVLEYIDYNGLSPLPPNAITFLNTASVYGYSFDYGIVSEASGLSTMDAIEAFDSLLRAGIVCDCHNACEFHHSVLAEAAYSRISSARRQYLHQKIAEVLESRSYTDTPEHCDILAYHYQKSGLFEKAAYYFALSGDMRLLSPNWTLAEKCYEQACQYHFLTYCPKMIEFYFHHGEQSKFQYFVFECITVAEKQNASDWAALFRLCLHFDLSACRSVFAGGTNYVQQNIECSNTLQATTQYLDSAAVDPQKLYFQILLHSIYARFAHARGDIEQACRFYEYVAHSSALIDSSLRYLVYEAKFALFCLSPRAKDQTEIMALIEELKRNNSEYLVPIGLRTLAKYYAVQGKTSAAEYTLEEAQKYASECGFTLS